MTRPALPAAAPVELVFFRDPHEESSELQATCNCCTYFCQLPRTLFSRLDIQIVMLRLYYNYGFKTLWRRNLHQTTRGLD